MPYKSTAQLPADVKSVLPRHAQSIYKEAFNHAWDQYQDPKERRADASREEVSHRVAWSAVKEKFEKGDNDTWRPKDSSRLLNQKA